METTVRFICCSVFRAECLKTLTGLIPSTMPSADFCRAISGSCEPISRRHGDVLIRQLLPDTRQISRGKFDSLPRTTAGSTATGLDGCGLRHRALTRPPETASYPVLVHRLTLSIHASFRPRLATTPLRFTFLHLHLAGTGTHTPQTVKHARHTLRHTGRLRQPLPPCPEETV
jgi:hypothetical protein